MNRSKKSDPRLWYKWYRYGAATHRYDETKIHHIDFLVELLISTGVRKQQMFEFSTNLGINYLNGGVVVSCGDRPHSLEEVSAVWVMSKKGKPIKLEKTFAEKVLNLTGN